MWDRARASATAGLDRMHRRHLTGSAGGFSSAPSYNDRPGADKQQQHAGDIAMPMSWTTISTSTSTSTFYQTNVDGPANALGIEVVANTAAAPQRPHRPHFDAQSARVTSALHSGMYVYCNMGAVLLVFSCMCTQLEWRWLRHARYMYFALCRASCAGTIPPVHVASFANVYHLPSLPQAHTGPLVEGTASSRCASNKERLRKNKAPCSCASDFLFSLDRIGFGRMMLFPRHLHCLPPLSMAL
jgi:hypothetical protein